LRAEAGHRYAAGGIRVSRGPHGRFAPFPPLWVSKFHACYRFAGTGKSIYLGNEIDIDPTGNDDGLHA
jgi:hypothetical protein